MDVNKKLSVYIVLLTVLTLTTACKEKTLVRKDLKGDPLVSDDFTYILGERTYNAFAMKATVDEWFSDGSWVKQKAFFSSEDPNMPGRWDLKTEEFLTDDIRYVYFEGIYYEIREGMNGFTSIKNNAMTIRGIKIGDSIDDVFDAYGKTDWAIGPNHHKGVHFPDMIKWGYKGSHMPFLEGKEDLIEAIRHYKEHYKL